MAGWGVYIAYELECPPDGTDPDQGGHDEQEGIRHPCSRDVTADQGLCHMSATAEWTKPPCHGSERARKSEPRHEMYGPET